MNRHRILGAVIDDQTRCIHYRTELDVIAILFFCCREFYPCHACPTCAAAFNPGCKLHAELYFQV